MKKMKIRLLCNFFLFSLCVRKVLNFDIKKLSSDSKLVSSVKTVRSLNSQITAVATTENSLRSSSRSLHSKYDDFEPRIMDSKDYDEVDDKPESKAVAQPRAEYWNGYYDFLINEGSYKFWAVFQLATAALLIYSGFAALYYAKVNPQYNDDYDDFLYRRRKRRSINRFNLPPSERPYFGLEPQALERILDAIARELN